MDLADHEQAEEQLLASQQQLRALSERLQAAREEERRQLAREIHDLLHEVLTGLKTDLAMLARTLQYSDQLPSTATVSGKIESISELLDETIQSVQRIIAELMPP